MLKPKNSQKFRKEYSQFISENHAFCQLCSCNFSVQHGGKDDCRWHVSSKKHQNFLKMEVATRPITSHFQSDATDPTTKAETCCVQPCGLLLNAMCPDSKIIQKYFCKQTKTTAIVQELAVFPRGDCNKYISIAADGSHHAGEETFYPIVVTAYRSDLGEIVSEVLAVPICKMSNTGENIFKLLNEELQKKASCGITAFVLLLTTVLL
ncbi:hypothetical protein PR048_032865 [Dryococelus australis]|uniref:Uncharacterized protein n=1 Tax=Dryococelus australis TaxID=614101 RepID=A0ABQ9G461_9NEOP|nr:hypothetical protein PR048_032865 [Dryococelus australis]